MLLNSSCSQTQTSVVKSQEHNKLYETSKARAQENNTASAPSLFEVSEVIPDVLDKPPKTVLEVKYGFTPVKLGQELTPAELVNEPEVNWNADPDKFYTLLFSCKYSRPSIAGLLVSYCFSIHAVLHT